MTNQATRGVYRNSEGVAISEPEVTVYLAGTSTLATIFSDRAGSPLGNPFTGNENGEWRFYSVFGQSVKVNVSKFGFEPWEEDWIAVGFDTTETDALYHPREDFLDVSTGAGSAGSPVVLDAGGKIDASMIEDSDVDHGALSGLSDDDHLLYHTDSRGDARYYQKTEFLSTSAGAGDAGKPVKLDAAGHIDATLVNDSDVDHGLLGGLTDDDHAQYALLAGRSSGQSIAGGTGSGETLTLRSTTHATKGRIILGSASAYNEVDDRLGLGTLIPLTRLQVAHNSAVEEAVRFDQTGSGNIQLRLSNAARAWAVRVTPNFVVRDVTGAVDALSLTTDQNMGFRGSSFGGGSGVVFLGNATTTPSTNPTSGVLLYPSGGRLFARSSSGHRGSFPINSFYDVKDFGAVGDGVTNDAAAIQSAIDAASTAGAGIVYFPTGIYAITASLTLKQGAYLQGVYPAAVTSALMTGSRIKAMANLTTMMTTDLVTAREGFGLRNLVFDGNKANFTVTTGIKFFGRKLRMENVDVTNVSGTGVHLVRTDFTPTPDQFCWVNWLQNCHVGGCAVGILQEASDSRFIGNYFGGNGTNQQKTSGGNIWMGNHFDNSTTAGMQFISDERGTSGVLSPGDRIIGNYFDINPVGVLFTSFDGSTQYEFNHIVEGNRFRANDVDIDIEDAINPGVSGSTHSPGPTTATGIRFTNCTQGLVEGVRFINRTYTSFFSGLPSNCAVRACVAGGSAVSVLRSEAHGTATILASGTSVTVTHGLFAAPLSVQLTGLNAGAVFFVNNITATTFDIQVSVSTGADRVVHWRASMSP